MMEEEKGISLQKYLARCGMGSRRSCENLISEGKVKINGSTVKEAGQKVLPGEEVRVDGKIVCEKPERYFIINKPKGYVSVNKDERGRKWVVDIVPEGRDMGLFPVGRLDLDTTGLMILTNDGNLANRISHPRYGVMKEYNALVKGKWNHNDLKDRLENGVVLKNGEIVDNVEVVSSSREEERTRVVLRIHEGRKHVVKRIFLAVGSRVYRLERTRIGELELPRIDTGEYMEISKSDIMKMVFDQNQDA